MTSSRAAIRVALGRMKEGEGNWGSVVERLVVMTGSIESAVTVDTFLLTKNRSRRSKPLAILSDCKMVVTRNDVAQGVEESVIS